jgi:adenylylsulfate kinase-like enzyme
VEAARARGPRAGEAHLKRLLVLVGGPIASGKSTVSRAVALRLREIGSPAAAVDVDLVYELLETRGHSPGDPEVWQRAHRLAGRIAAALFAEGVEIVLVEGDVHAPAAREALLATAGAGDVLTITLAASLETALRRVRMDDDRGISRDPTLLARHYETVGPTLLQRPREELLLDTDALQVADIVERVVAQLVRARRSAGAAPR